MSELTSSEEDEYNIEEEEVKSNIHQRNESLSTNSQSNYTIYETTEEDDLDLNRQNDKNDEILTKKTKFAKFKK